MPKIGDKKLRVKKGKKIRSVFSYEQGFFSHFDADLWQNNSATRQIFALWPFEFSILWARFLCCSNLTFYISKEVMPFFLFRVFKCSGSPYQLYFSTKLDNFCRLKFCTEIANNQKSKKYSVLGEVNWKIQIMYILYIDYLRKEV